MMCTKQIFTFALSDVRTAVEVIDRQTSPTNGTHPEKNVPSLTRKMLVLKLATLTKPLQLSMQSKGTVDGSTSSELKYTIKMNFTGIR